MSRPTIREVLGREGRGRLPDPETERRFFNAIRLSNGVFKTTAVSRLRDVDAFVLEHVPSDRPLAIMDVAVSSGVTTQEWADHLRAHGVEHTMVAGDLTAHGTLVTVGGVLEALFETSGHPLQFDVLGVALPNSPGTRGAYLAHRILRRASHLLRGRGLTKLSGVDARLLQLVSPRVRVGAGVELLSDDILAPNPSELRERFHVVRAANILNPSYFEPPTIRRMAASLAERLRDGGLLVVCKTEDDGTNGAALYRRNDSKLEAVATFGNGVPVHALVLGQ